MSLPTSFPFVQAVSATAPFTGIPSIQILNVEYGNILIAVFSGLQQGTPFPNGGPTSVTDGVNTFELYGQLNGGAENSPMYAQIWVAEDVTGGNLTLTFNGIAATFPVGSPSVGVIEFDHPTYYEIFGIDDANNVGAHNYSLFRAFSNDGIGTANGDTGNNDFTGTVLSWPSGFVKIENDASSLSGCNVCAIALINQFINVKLICLTYSQGTHDWTSQLTYQDGTTASGNVRIITLEDSHDIFNDHQTLCISDGDFDYLGGPTQADCDNPPNGTIGEAYSHTLVAGGGDGTYTFTKVGGDLPPGLSLNSSTGEISGTPTVIGKFTFTILVCDMSGSCAQPIVCDIAICPAEGAGGSFAMAYYSRH